MNQELEIEISNGQKIRIKNIRINGDIVDAQNDIVTQGAGIELNQDQVLQLGAQNVQVLSDAFFGINRNESAQ